MPIVSAVAAIAVAVAVLVAVAAGASSIREVTSNPVRYGADFDAIVVGAAATDEAQEDLWATVASQADVAAAAGIPGSTVMTDSGELYVQAFRAGARRRAGPPGHHRRSGAEP